MPKFMVSASEEVFYLKEVEAQNKEQAYEVFAKTISNDDIVEGRGFEIEEIRRIKNVH